MYFHAARYVRPNYLTGCGVSKKCSAFAVEFAENSNAQARIDTFFVTSFVACGAMAGLEERTWRCQEGLKNCRELAGNSRRGCQSENTGGRRDASVAEAGIS